MLAKASRVWGGSVTAHLKVRCKTQLTFCRRQGPPMIPVSRPRRGPSDALTLPLPLDSTSPQR